MEEILNKILKKISISISNSKSAFKELKKIKMLLEKENLTKLTSQVESKNLKNILVSLHMESLYNELKEKLKGYTASGRMEFDKKFLSSCQKLNLGDVKGDSMNEFQIRGILHVQIEFNKNIATLKTFTCSKKIKSLEPAKIAQECEKEIKRLFNRSFEAKKFLTELHKSYQKLQTEPPQKIVLLKSVHRNMWLERQKNDFFEISNPAKMVSYPLDEFSVDLSKLIESGITKTDDGYVYNISLGSGGVNIYASDGSFNCYKFLEFVKKE